MKLETFSMRSTYESEAPMSSHGYFHRGNEKQTRKTSHSLRVPYTSRISYRVLNLVFFSGKRRGRLFQILSLKKGVNSKRGAYLKFTQSLIPLRGFGGMDERKAYKVNTISFLHPSICNCVRASCFK